jgi:hypothetical protein
MYVVCKLCVPFYAYYIDLKPKTQTTFLTFFKGDNFYFNWHDHLLLPDPDPNYRHGMCFRASSVFVVSILF